MKILRMIVILVCVFAVVVATAKPRDNAKPEKAKVEQKAPKQERADTRAKPAEKSRSSVQKTYKYTAPSSRDRDTNSKPSVWNRDDNRDRNTTGNSGDWNRNSSQKTYTYPKLSSGDRDRDRNTTGNSGDWNRNPSQKTYTYPKPSSGDRDRDRDPADFNRDGDRDRNPADFNRDGDRDHRADKNWRPDRDDRRDERHSRYDRVRDHDGWWLHHRYADKAYKHDKPELHKVFWCIDWGRPYYGRYYNRWHYIPLVTVVFRSEKQPPLLGAAIVAYDDTFLGIVSRDWQDIDSISNPYGRFGCPESPWSIWNTDGQWGNYYSFDSPWSPDATRPPRVYSGDYFLGYLTANEDLYPRIDPYWLIEYLDIWVMD